MPILAKLIFRVDFQYSYGFLDRQGTALRLLREPEGDFWDNVAENPAQHSMRADKLTASAYYNLSFEPTSVNGVWEDSSGIELSKVLESDVFHIYNRKLRSFLEEFQVDSVRRCGLRLYCTEISAAGSDNLRTFEQIVSRSLLEKVTDVLGPSRDIGLHIVGRSEDEIYYHLNFGPIIEKDISQVYQFLDVTPDIKSSFLRSSLLFDVDLSETNFSFREHSLARWSRTKVEKVLALIASVREQIRGQSA